mmetsp:Transcript_21592/g.31939  ORF Transcript_21592/g.31939 Transcript_21592/m.31939 type:complete len:295 (+) Transcript_21592:164-1048(+)|eukprot:CAMPEP_0194215338 /NCGR_PEP_ID=MMETSP0156-20130528/17095_1 /TAXON_ID=33649 /ORGANISM="Thalassionema nitzschioides, Strain L26-B" /LENGTH=294 /DNA_ID=CAMNT_0038943833 /DNA_START=143 /DNA_END=1027 /DNA_ORIENTATION=+
MNISLASASQNIDKKRKLAHGLNNKKTQINVFGGTEDDEVAESSRGQVNRELHREQELLRQRASAAVYDFDGTYDKTNEENRVKNTNEPKGKKESRYMANLLQNAKRRNHERDVAYERKMAREQKMEEEENPEFRGKEKFITSAYKKKLEEHELWAQEEESQRIRDEESDVTKRKGDGVISFYSNFSKNKAVGGSSAQDTQKAKSHPQGFADGFEAASRSHEGKNVTQSAHLSDMNLKSSEDMGASFSEGISKGGSSQNSKRLGQLRSEKMVGARLRYYDRRGLTEDQALQETL